MDRPQPTQMFAQANPLKQKSNRARGNKQTNNRLPQTWGIPSWRICCRDRQYDVGMRDKMTDGCRNCQYPPSRFHRHRSTGRWNPDRKTWRCWWFVISLTASIERQNQHLIQKHEILTASVGRADHDTRPFRLAAHKNPTQLFDSPSVCLRPIRKREIFGFNDAKQKYKSPSGPAAATCRLGSWRPTGEVPLHLGRAMMMMHTSWSLASDTALKTPVHILLSLSYLPALNTWSQKAFFQQSFILRRLAFSFAF